MDYMGNDLAPILVTGADGYLGGHVLAKLKEQNLQGIATSRNGEAGNFCDLTDICAVRILLDKIKPSAIIHCAAVVPKKDSTYDDAQAANASVAMVKNIVESVSCPVIFASSMTVYTGAREFPVHEECFQPPVAGYAQGKWLAEQVLFSRSCPGDVALRLPGLFGLPRRSGLLYNAARSLLVHGEFKLSSFTSLWAAMAVEDAAEYLIRAALMPRINPPQAINVGYEGSFSIPDAVAEIADICNIDWNVPTTQLPPFSMCLQRLERYYGILPKTFRNRLEELVDAVRNDLASELGVDFNAN